jgi:hypothetical protein
MGFPYGPVPVEIVPTRADTPIGVRVSRAGNTPMARHPAPARSSPNRAPTFVPSVTAVSGRDLRAVSPGLFASPGPSPFCGAERRRGTRRRCDAATSGRGLSVAPSPAPPLGGTGSDGVNDSRPDVNHGASSRSPPIDVDTSACPSTGRRKRGRPAQHERPPDAIEIEAAAVRVPWSEKEPPLAPRITRDGAWLPALPRCRPSR